MKYLSYLKAFSFTGTISAVIISILLLGSTGVHAADINVYLVYVGADKKIVKIIRSSLPKDLAVRKYNASMLLMADYSGKQKVIAKLSKAKLVVFMGDSPKKLLGQHQFKKQITISGAGEAELKQILGAL